MSKRSRAFSCSVGGALLCSFSTHAFAASSIPEALDAMGAVHEMGEVALSPDGKHVVYGTEMRGKRGSDEVDVTALWIANAKDGSNATRLTACPQSVCDEHGAVWSPDGKQIAFVTTDAADQTQIAVASADGRDVKSLTRARGPVDTPRWSPDGKRLAFLYSKDAPKTP